MLDIEGLDYEIETEEKMIDLVLDDGSTHSLSLKFVPENSLIQTILDNDSTTKSVQLHDISLDVMRMIISYLEYSYSNPLSGKIIELSEKEVKTVPSKNLADIVEDEWYVKFMDVSDGMLKQLAIVSNYLGIHLLLVLTSAKIGTVLKGKTHEEIASFFR